MALRLTFATSAPFRVLRRLWYTQHHFFLPLSIPFLPAFSAGAIDLSCVSARGEIPAMDNSHSRSPPPTRPQAIGGHSYSSQRLPRHDSFMASDASLPFSKSAAMSIPNQRAPSPPPPLPPPRFVHDIAVGLDPGYHYSNSQSREEFESRIGCVSPDSRLRKSWALPKDEAMDFDQPDERESRRSPSIQDFHAMGHIDEGYHSLSGSSLAQRLAYSGSGGSLLGQRSVYLYPLLSLTLIAQ